MKIIAFILNLPWTIIGLLVGIVSFPKKITINKKPMAFVFHGARFWWLSWHSRLKYVRGMAVGNVVLLGQNVLPNDLEHELIHVEQIEREPFIHPLLYSIESFKKGYRNNKYEVEAYDRAGNVYLER